MARVECRVTTKIYRLCKGSIGNRNTVSGLGFSRLEHVGFIGLRGVHEVHGAIVAPAMERGGFRHMWARARAWSAKSAWGEPPGVTGSRPNQCSRKGWAGCTSRGAGLWGRQGASRCTSAPCTCPPSQRQLPWTETATYSVAPCSDLVGALWRVRCSFRPENRGPMSSLPEQVGHVVRLPLTPLRDATRR
jgi:hypothetical protein